MIEIPWSEQKKLIDAGYDFSYITDISENYIIFTIDGPIVYMAKVAKTTPRNADQIDFEDNYKSNAKVTVNPKVIDKNAKNEHVIRVVTTDPKNPDPSDLTLSNSSVDDGEGSGTVVGTITTTDGNSPYTYAITQDPDNKFKISGDELQLSSTVDYTTKTSHSVTIEVTDLLGRAYSEAFTVIVNEFGNSTKISFNGVDEYVNAGDISFDPENLSVSFWFSFPSSMSGIGRPVCAKTVSNTTDVQFRIWKTNIDKLRFFVGDSSDTIDDLAGNTVVSVDTRYHVVCTYDHDGGGAGISQLKIFINGAEDASGTTNISPLNSDAGVDFKMAAYHDNTTGQMECFIDELAIIDKPLSLSEVQEIYNSGQPGDLNKVSFANSISHWWRSEKSTAPNLRDVITGIDATMVNMTSSNFVSV